MMPANVAQVVISRTGIILTQSAVLNTKGSKELAMFCIVSSDVAMSDRVSRSGSQIVADCDTMAENEFHFWQGNTTLLIYFTMNLNQL